MSAQAEHMRRKQAEGICRYGGCWEEARKDRVMCPKHAVEDAFRARQWRARQHAAAQPRVRE
jgi:hypothetical protein